MGTSGDEALERAREWLGEHGIVAPEPDLPVPPGSTPRAVAPGLRSQPESAATGRKQRDAGKAKQKQDLDPEAVARTVVLRKLSVRAQTRAELQQALEAKGVPDEPAQAVLDRMVELGLVDDVVFARDWVESRQQRRHLSRRILQQELRHKGVERETIEEALKQVDGEDELAAARAIVEKRRASLDRLEPKVRYRRLAGVLGRRGYSSAVVSAVLGEALGHGDSRPSERR